MNYVLKPAILDAISEHGLPENFSDTVSEWYEPLAADIVKQHQDSSSSLPLLIGIQGCQGSGKSTCAEFLKLLFEHEYDLNSVVLSIDDFYLTRAERQQLAENIHPLLMTRGVPGTHDLQLAASVIEQLSVLKAGQTFSVPRFNKVTDDRFDESDWSVIDGPVDIIIFEGWCVGVSAQTHEELMEPINELECKEDPDMQWRKYVNQQLKGEYQTFFQKIDSMVTLVAPSFECVSQWRALQEQKLIDRIKKMPNQQPADNSVRTMSPKELKRFISHYERLTRHALITLPQFASWVFKLNNNHGIDSLQKNNG